MREFLLLIIARFSLTILSPFLICYGLIKGTLNGTLFTWFKDIAISIDRLGNVLGMYAFNDLLGYNFGNGKETISARLGYNKLNKTEKPIGKFISKCLNLLDPSHVEKAVLKDIEK